MKKYQYLLFGALIILSSALWCEVGFKRGLESGEQKTLKLWDSYLDQQISLLKIKKDEVLLINHSEIK